MSGSVKISPKTIIKKPNASDEKKPVAAIFFGLLAVLLSEFKRYVVAGTVSEKIPESLNNRHIGEYYAYRARRGRVYLSYEKRVRHIVQRAYKHRKHRRHGKPQYKFRYGVARKSLEFSVSFVHIQKIAAIIN